MHQVHGKSNISHAFHSYRPLFIYLLLLIIAQQDNNLINESAMGVHCSVLFH